MPSNVGTWPAFWMMGDACDDTSTGNYTAPITYYDGMASNWSSCGEIDIMEHRNTETIVFQNLLLGLAYRCISLVGNHKQQCTDDL